MNASLKFNLEQTSDELIAREYSLEEEALLATIERVRAQFKSQGVDTSATGKQQVAEWLPLLAEGITKWEEQQSKGRKPLAYRYISIVKPEVLAYATARGVVQSLLKGSSVLTKLAEGIGRSVRDIVEFEQLTHSQRDVAKALEHRLRYTEQRRREPLIRNALEAHHFEGLSWDKESTVALGVVLLEITETVTGYIELGMGISKGNTTRIVTITEEALSWLEQSEMKEALLAPVHYPMLVPPKPWSTPYNGGYLNAQLQPLELLLANRRVVNRRIENVHMPQVYSAINAAQATPWRVNKDVFNVFRHLVTEKLALAGLPASEDLPLPERPWDRTLSEIDVQLWIQFNKETFDKWKREAAKIHKENSETTSKRYSVTQKMYLAEKFAPEAAIYYPMCADYRGRLNSVAGSGSMNPQSDDSGKALLHFACGQPLGENGGYWLAVACANHFGEDKLPLDERVEWAETHTSKMCEVASNPIENTWWMEADKPFCFLAACFEWAGFMSVGDSFVSHLPIPLDGSCSGLQHFGAMLLDEETLKNTNVLQDGEKPSDVYSKVRNSVAVRILRDDSQMAQEWTTRLHRDSVKQPSMTKAYGVSVRGMIRQIEEATARLRGKKRIVPFTEGDGEAAKYLAPHVDSAISEVVAAASYAMDWLKAVASVCAEAGIPMKHTTPMGLEVTQEYRKSKKKRLELLYKGQRMQLSLEKDTPVIDKRRSCQAAAPNYVHSMDAAHLMATLNLCVDNGVDTFACIHDSFATHAGSTETMWIALRYAFLQQYSGNVLLDTYNEIREQLPEASRDSLPLPPTQGIAKLEAVMYSDFFFA